MNLQERTGEKFNLQHYLYARIACQSIVESIASLVSEGMTEPDGQQLIKDEFNKNGITKFWHPSKFRIGSDTTKSFRELPDKSISLTKGEMFFIDVGPIIDDHEADYGKTFIYNNFEKTNQPLENLAAASETVWKETANKWRNEFLTGEALYKFAKHCAEDYTYTLNPLMDGHRLGDFPHSLFTKESLSTQNFKPSENLWVLEIHLISPTLNRGSFFEDILKF